MKGKIVVIAIMSMFLLTACSSNDVEITLPEEFFDSNDLEAIEKDITDQVDAEVKENKDGTLSLTMSKKEHDKWLGEVRETLDDGIKEIASDDSFQSISDIEHNKDYTEFSVFVDAALYEESFDSFVSFSIGLQGVMYQIFNGEDMEKQKVVVKIIDEDSNETIDEINFPEAFEGEGDMEE